MSRRGDAKRQRRRHSSAPHDRSAGEPTGRLNSSTTLSVAPLGLPLLNQPPSMGLRPGLLSNALCGLGFMIPTAASNCVLTAHAALQMPTCSFP